MIWRDDFAKIDMRVWTIVTCEIFTQARKPAYKMEIDFWPDIGIKKTSAQITHHYQTNDCVGKQIIAVINFPPKQIWPIMSECLVMWIYDENNDVVLLQPERTIKNWCKVG